MLDVKSPARPRRQAGRHRAVAALIARRTMPNACGSFSSPGRPASSAFMSRAGCSQSGRSVVGVDNMNAYYDPGLKEARLRGAREVRRVPLSSSSTSPIATAWPRCSREHRFPFVVHLAAQAGVRYSLVDPHAYVDANLQGFINVLEGCRHNGCRHLLFASSSSVYGANTQAAVLGARQCRPSDQPLCRDQEGQRADGACLQPSVRLPATGLRFFTVYGPWGRPDMAMFIFATAIVEGRADPAVQSSARCGATSPISTTSTEAVVRLIDRVPAPDPAWSGDAPDPATQRGALAHLQHRQQ